jgi:hypothetical protein
MIILVFHLSRGRHKDNDKRQRQSTKSVTIYRYNGPLGRILYRDVLFVLVAGDLHAHLRRERFS